MRALKIVTRMKELDPDDNLKPRIVVLNMKMLQAHFSSPLSAAADRLGISLTALKWFVTFDILYEMRSEFAFFVISACRKLGVKKWPYRKVGRCFGFLQHCK